MNKNLICEFNYIISYVSPRLQGYINKLNEDVIIQIQEIRIRCDRPIVIITDKGSSFLMMNLYLLL